MSPKQNREIPELNYDRVYQLKNDFPDLEIVINGGITSVEDSIKHLKVLDGVMIGGRHIQTLIFWQMSIKRYMDWTSRW